jgi:hypothetical protein
MGHLEEAPFDQDWDLGREDRNQHVDDEGKRREACQKTGKYEDAAADLNQPYEGSHNFRVGDADLEEPANAQGIRVDELLYSLREEHPADHQPD